MPNYKRDFWVSIEDGDLYVRGFTDAEEAVAYLAEQDPAINAPAELGLSHWVRSVPVRGPWENSRHCAEFRCDHRRHLIETTSGKPGAFPVIQWQPHEWWRNDEASLTEIPPR